MLSISRYCPVVFQAVEPVSTPRAVLSSSSIMWQAPSTLAAILKNTCHCGISLKNEIGHGLCSLLIVMSLFLLWNYTSFLELSLSWIFSLRFWRLTYSPAMENFSCVFYVFIIALRLRIRIDLCAVWGASKDPAPLRIARWLCRFTAGARVSPLLCGVAFLISFWVRTSCSIPLAILSSRGPCYGRSAVMQDMRV